MTVLYFDTDNIHVFSIYILRDLKMNIFQNYLTFCGHNVLEDEYLLFTNV